MRRFVGAGLSLALILCFAGGALAQDTGGTSTRATTLCVVIYGETPDAGWDVMSLLPAMTSGKAVIAEIKEGSACAESGSVAPPPVSGAGPFFTLSGSSSTNSAPFAAPAQWQLQYTYDCSGTGLGRGNFQVWLYNGSDPAGVLVNELGESGSSSSYVYEGGPAMHVEVISSCDWSITATS